MLSLQEQVTALRAENARLKAGSGVPEKPVFVTVGNRPKQPKPATPVLPEVYTNAQYDQWDEAMGGRRHA